MKLRNKSIRDLRDEINELQAKFNTLVTGAQSHCSHRALGECDYKPLEYFYPLPPIRICLSCGLTEERQGYGYKVLISKNIKCLDREEIYALRCGKIIQQ